MLTCVALLISWTFVSSFEPTEWFHEAQASILAVNSCPSHANQELCESETINDCLWFEDDTHPVSILANSQCIEKKWAECKMADINSVCSDGRRNRTPRPTKADRNQPTKPPKSRYPTLSGIWDRSSWKKPKTPRPTPLRYALCCSLCFVNLNYIHTETIYLC